MRSGKVVGAEALIRWQHPDKGLLAPAAFLPVIEDHPLAVAVGEWVIETALHQIAAWQAAGLDMPVSVNIGARQLQQGDFVERLQCILALHPHVSAAKLELEVLETSALNDIEHPTGSLAPWFARLWSTINTKWHNICLNRDLVATVSIYHPMKVCIGNAPLGTSTL